MSRPLHLYVAGKYEERARVQDIMAQLRAVGHTITYDWTLSEQLSRTQAFADKEGVRVADALVLVVEKALPYCGTLVEFGMALAWRIPVYIVGHALDDHCIFILLPELHRGIEDLLRSPVPVSQKHFLV